MKSKFLAVFEILIAFAVVLFISIAGRSIAIVQWENKNLGWSYTLMLLLIGITTLVMVLTRRNWSEYGVSTTNWRINLDIGIKGYLIRFIPVVFGLGGAAWLGLDSNKLSGGAFVSIIEIIALVLMVWVLNHPKVVKSGKANLIAIGLLLLLPIGVALALGRLNLVIVSTVIRQFILTGFGEEFIFRGYMQSRLNHAFGRPMCLSGIQFGVGLIITSLLFGFWHAFNTYDPTIGFSSLAWGWALYAFAGGVVSGVMREKTGTLLASGIAHGLGNAVGQSLNMIFRWF